MTSAQEVLQKQIPKATTMVQDAVRSEIRSRMRVFVVGGSLLFIGGCFAFGLGKSLPGFAHKVITDRPRNPPADEKWTRQSVRWICKLIRTLRSKAPMTCAECYRLVPKNVRVWCIRKNPRARIVPTAGPTQYTQWCFQLFVTKAGPNTLAGLNPPPVNGPIRVKFELIESVAVNEHAQESPAKMTPAAMTAPMTKGSIKSLWSSLMGLTCRNKTTITRVIVTTASHISTYPNSINYSVAAQLQSQTCLSTK